MLRARIVLFLFAVAVLGAGASSPVAGRWKSIDDKTGKPRAVILLWEEKGLLFGKVESSFNPQNPPKRCVKCTDERKNQVIVGMVIIRNMRAKGDEYADGDILDPDSGSVYRCKMKLTDKGARMVVRGYMGFSLFGRSQTWTRIKE